MLAKNLLVFAVFWNNLYSVLCVASYNKELRAVRPLIKKTNTTLKFKLICNKKTLNIYMTDICYFFSRYHVSENILRSRTWIIISPRTLKSSKIYDVKKSIKIERRECLSCLQTSLYYLFGQLHTAAKERQQVFTQAGTDVTMMQTFLHQQSMSETLPGQRNSNLARNMLVVKFFKLLY